MKAGLMPNSTKASQNRILNLKSTTNDSRNDSVEGTGTGLHKSYNGNISKHGGGL
jgi:hypothetical protein